MSRSHSVQPVIVVSHKRVEGPQLHPSDAQLLGGAATKAADVRPSQWHPEQAELQHRWGEEMITKGQSDSIYKKKLHEEQVERFNSSSSTSFKYINAMQLPQRTFKINYNPRIPGLSVSLKVKRRRQKESYTKGKQLVPYQGWKIAAAPSRS